jgi:histidinol dehydrogenase
VLPTSGAARAYSGVSVGSFQNYVSVQAVEPRGITAIGQCALVLAQAEGLTAHGNAVALRMARAASA